MLLIHPCDFFLWDMMVMWVTSCHSFWIPLVGHLFQYTTLEMLWISLNTLQHRGSRRRFNFCDWREGWGRVRGVAQTSNGSGNCNFDFEEENHEKLHQYFVIEICSLCTITPQSQVFKSLWTKWHFVSLLFIFPLFWNRRALSNDSFLYLSTKISFQITVRALFITKMKRDTFHHQSINKKWTFLIYEKGGKAPWGFHKMGWAWGGGTWRGGWKRLN